MMNQKGRLSAFTLIELLIVVAIIAILAAIAVPNFLEAQTRSKVARCKADQRTLATAMEAYYVDNNTYVRDSDSSLDQAELGVGAVDPTSAIFGQAANGAIQLTTPIAYITSILADPFGVGGTVAVSGGTAIGYRIGSGSWSYADPAPVAGDHQDAHKIFAQQGPRGAYVIIGVGPDQGRCRMGHKAFPFEPVNNPKEGPPSTTVNSSKQPFCYTEYDPTNGVNSVGDVYRFGGSSNEGRYMLNGAVVGNPNPTGGDAF